MTASPSPSTGTSVQFSHNTLAVLLCKSYYKCKIINIECILVVNGNGGYSHAQWMQFVFFFMRPYFASHALMRNDLGRMSTNISARFSPLFLFFHIRIGKWNTEMSSAHKTISHRCSHSCTLNFSSYRRRQQKGELHVRSTIDSHSTHNSSVNLCGHA